MLTSTTPIAASSAPCPCPRREPPQSCRRYEEGGAKGEGTFAKSQFERVGVRGDGVAACGTGCRRARSGQMIFKTAKGRSSADFSPKPPGRRQRRSPTVVRPTSNEPSGMIRSARRSRLVATAHYLVRVMWAMLSARDTLWEEKQCPGRGNPARVTKADNTARRELKGSTSRSRAGLRLHPEVATWRIATPPV